MRRWGFPSTGGSSACRRPSGCSGAPVSGRAPARPRRSRSSVSTAPCIRCVNPGLEQLVGPKPHDAKGHPLAPADAWGHDHCWWLDRMVRTSRPLVERMTLVWHDWFATSNAGVGSQKLMLAPERALPQPRPRLVPAAAARRDQGSGDAALAERHPEREGRAERELRARDDGALHARRRPRRVHRARRARAGAVADRLAEQLEAGARRLRLPLRPHAARHRHEDGVPQVGPLRLAATPASSASRTRCTRRSSCSKLWATSSRPRPTARRKPRSKRSTATAARSSRSCRRSSQHPVLYDGPRMVKPPIVHLAGLLRRIGAGITTTDWAWIGSLSGQQLFYPPNVAGWDDTRWLDTATFRGRWIAVAADPAGPQARSRRRRKKPMRRARRVLRRALAFWNNPALADGDARGAAALRARGARATPARTTGSSEQYPVLRRERAPPADRHLPGPADLMSRDRLRRVHARGRAARRRRHAACRRSSRACRRRPGPGLTRRSFVARSLGLALVGLRRRAACSSSTRASPRPRPLPRQPDPRHRVPAGRRGRALAALSGRRPAVPQAAPDLAVDGRHAVHRGRAAAAGTRRSRRSRSCTARARSPCCRRSATTIPTSRTSRRATSGRSARPIRRC